MNELQDTIFMKLGGLDMIHKTIDSFYDRVLKDSRVNHFFKYANMDMQRGKMKAFLIMSLGGPFKFTGKDINNAHKHLVKKGLNDQHFDIVAEHLDNALEEFHVAVDIREQISQVVENCRDLVLNK
jgi:truncated hemoglobin YjbI